MTQSETAIQLLDAAQRLVQERGYQAFSYKDLATEVGIRTASIHYHFPAKEDLGRAVMARYLDELEMALAAIERGGRSSRARLKAFIALHRATEKRGAICVCGSLASDGAALPASVQSVVVSYLERCQGWVAETIRAGVRDGEFEVLGNGRDAALMLVAGLQGGLILSRTQGAALLGRLERSFFNLLRSS